MAKNFGKSLEARAEFVGGIWDGQSVYFADGRREWEILHDDVVTRYEAGKEKPGFDMPTVVFQHIRDLPAYPFAAQKTA